VFGQSLFGRRFMGITLHFTADLCVVRVVAQSFNHATFAIRFENSDHLQRSPWALAVLFSSFADISGYPLI